MTKQELLHEDSFKFDYVRKVLLALPVLLVIALGMLFLRNTETFVLFPSVPRMTSRYLAILFFVMAAWLLLFYRIVMPRRIYILSDRIWIRYGLFSKKIPFAEIVFFRMQRGDFAEQDDCLAAYWELQIEIVRKDKKNLHLSLSDPEMFLEKATKAYLSWQKSI